MVAAPLTVADLVRPPGDVARTRVAWQRGDHDEAVAATLALSARSSFQRTYTAWIWLARDAARRPAWLLPVATAAAERFTPPGSMAVLTRTLRAAVVSGAEPSALELVDWDGHVGLVAPGADPLLASIALDEHHPAPGRAATADAPADVVVDGPPLELTPLAAGTAGAGLVALAREVRTHPLAIAPTLIEQGWTLEEAAYPGHVADLLRHRGLAGPPERPAAPRLAIEDDPCPRRRHARRVLRRLLHKRKVGAGHHTEFDHVARGAAPEDRADALLIGEALVRAGLLGEKPSVGQRHVYLARDALPRIHALIERGETDDPALAAEWTAPPPGAGR